jgi:GntR family transcriptional regulator, transcriptional repressor for pyruvate dehydrogenase complex
MHPVFRPLKNPDKVVQAVEALHEYVLEGNLKPGIELPAESAMAKQLGVSRFSMREALRVAQSEGLVEISQGRRTRVASVSARPATRILNLILRRSEGPLLDLTEVRKCLESQIARLAAERAKAGDIDKMSQTIEAMKHDSKNLNICINHDLEFHKALVRSTSNMVFEIMLAPLAELLYQSRLQTLHFSGVQKACNEHTRILGAIKKKDPDLAEACMRDHLQTAENNLKEITGEEIEG